MARRTRNRHELRAAIEAAEARGLNTSSSSSSQRPSGSSDAGRATSGRSASGPRMKVVWAVCDLGGRTVATFDYPHKADAEALVQTLKAQGKGKHFVRSVKEPM